MEKNIPDGAAVVSVGLSDLDPTSDASFHDVFERADSRMYERKQKLKDMGAITRDE